MFGNATCRIIPFYSYSGNFIVCEEKLGCQSDLIEKNTLSDPGTEALFYGKGS